MAMSYNSADIIGNIGEDPDCKYSTSGTAIANFSVATNEGYKDKSTNEWIDKTEWHKCVAFGQLADIVQEHIKKGDKVFVRGSLETQKWQDQQGVDRYTTKIKADKVIRLNSRDQQQQGAYGQANQQPNQQGYAAQNYQQSSYQAPPPPPPNDPRYNPNGTLKSTIPQRTNYAAQQDDQIPFGP